MRPRKGPDLARVDAGQVEELLALLKGELTALTYEKVALFLHTLTWVLGLMEQQSTSLRRLKRLIFGSPSEKTQVVFPKAAIDSSVAKPGPSVAISKRMPLGSRK